MLQVQTQVLYQRLRVTLAAVQLSTGSSASSLPVHGTCVLSPCQCTAYLDLHRASGDAVLPQLKALVELDRVKVQLVPFSLAVLEQGFTWGGAETDAEHARPERGQEV